MTGASKAGNGCGKTGLPETMVATLDNWSNQFTSELGVTLWRQKGAVNLQSQGLTLLIGKMHNGLTNWYHHDTALTDP
jgi:hypothetical protein